MCACMHLYVYISVFRDTHAHVFKHVFPFIINENSLQSYSYACIKVYIHTFFFYTHINIDCRANAHTRKVLHAHLNLHKTRYTMTGYVLTS